MIRLFLILLFFYSCGTMNEMSLYEESLINNNKLNDFYSQEVFETGGTDEVWGHEKEICNPFSYSSLDDLWITHLILKIIFLRQYKIL